jgi:hypothetical protein
MRRCFMLLILLLAGTISATACTGVVIARDGQVLVGGNEDWQRWDSWMWAEAARGALHGAVYFGYEVHEEFGGNDPNWYEFHGVNDQGLYFDSFGSPCAGLPEGDLLKARLSGSIERLMMEWCATVEDAIRLFEQYDRSFMLCTQYLIVDKTGAAVVIEGGDIIRMEGDTFALTNFHLSDPSHGSWPCWRYTRATGMLEDNSEPTVERLAAILNATHVPSTRYSVVCDLVAETATVYFAGDFRLSAVLDVAELCRVGSERILIASLIDDQN